MASIPVVMTPSGMQPQDPSAINAEVLAGAVALSPGLTATLPGSLIEDMTSSATGAVIVCDQAAVESVNNVTPLGANEFVLNALALIYGVQPGVTTNTAVNVVFSGNVGFVVAIGFTVSDGTHQYVVRDGGIIASDGNSEPLLCVATQPGSWAVPSNTVTSLVTSLPPAVTVTCNNPLAGTPSAGAQTVAEFRAQVMQAGLATCQGTSTFMKTQLQNVPGVTPRLISVRPVVNGYEVLVGGSGDPLEVGYAIFKSVGDVTLLQGSVLLAATITNANPGVVTTNITHLFSTGQVITVAGASPGAFNGTYTITVIDSHTFSLGADTSGFGAYTVPGVITPNFRNEVASINQYPDTYNIPYVLPAQQIVTMGVIWNTTAPNYVANDTVSGLAAPALADYVNSVPVGQPLNLFILQDVFQQAVAGVIPTAQLTRMEFSVNIDGVSVPPESGTGIIAGDPESYFTAVATGIAVSRG